MILGYIDPAVGATIMQLVVAGTVGVGAIVKLKWQSVRSLLGRGESAESELPNDAKIMTEEPVETHTDS